MFKNKDSSPASISQPDNEDPLQEDIPLSSSDLECCDKENEIPDMGIEMEVNEPTSQTEPRFDPSSPDVQKSTAEQGTQCRLPLAYGCHMNYCSLATDSRALQFYTSFENDKHFRLFFTILGPSVDAIQQFTSLPDRLDQLLLTLIKLRQCKEDYELSLMFGISRSTVSALVTVWINYLYYQLREINLWPDEGVVESFMPASFRRNFPTTKLIIDATEIPVEKPKNANAQSATFSTYKNRNTVKTVVGCIPRGAVVYVSDTYGGSCSDRQIMERSTLLSDNSKFSANSSIMADRGIMIQDLFAS